METSLETWWVMSLIFSPNYLGTTDTTSSSLIPTICILLLSAATLAVIAWLTTSLLHWNYPGGPAWGKYWWGRKPFAYSTLKGPKGLPVIGSMNLMSGLSHRKLADLANRLGAKRLMSLSLGETRVIVCAHPDVAKEILNSPVFADRPMNHSAYGLMFDRAIGFATYGAYWRSLRRIASTHLFSPGQVEASSCHRADIAAQMIDAIHSCKGNAFQVRGILRRASLYYIMQSVFGKRYHVCSSDSEVERLLCMVEQGYELLGMNNWSDHFPLLARLDLQSVQSRCSELMPKVNQFVNRIIDEHRSSAGSRKERDFVDILLSVQKDEALSDSDMAAILWEMIFRGTDAMAVQMEWTLARLILHPDAQAKVHAEIDQVNGRSKPITESDSASLVYLQALHKEVLRIHPPGPLLAWCREAITDTFIDGQLIPAGTTAMINMWAITHDPEVWDEPDKFRPERFLIDDGSKLVDFSVMGTDLRLAPFGAGRRSCPGKGLAMTTIGFWMASLLHEFEWLPVEGKKVDLSEELKLSCEMATPLGVRVRKRRIA